MILLPSTIEDAIQYANERGCDATINDRRTILTITLPDGSQNIIPLGKQVRTTKRSTPGEL